MDKNEMWVVKDHVSGRFLNQWSIVEYDNRVCYSTYDGKLRTRFFKWKRDAEELVEILQTYIQKMGLTTSLTIDVVNPDNLPLGKTLCEYIPIS